jgi:enamine deaminase RidA (YjgF/YER057c/UK114 family)
LVSGTASIAASGRTAYAGDFARQMKLTLRIVAALLRSRGMDWEDVTRGIAYFADPHDVPIFRAHCRDRGIAGVPLAVAHAAICRAGLLFELELDAARTSPRSR